MGKFKLLITIACCAIIAAVFVLFAPSHWIEVSIVAEKNERESTTINAPKKNALEEQLQKVVTLRQAPQGKEKTKKKTYIRPPSDEGQVQAVPPTSFNEVMVKSAVAFANKIGTCSRKTCPQIIDPSTEQWRIYAKTITDAKNACSRRQLNACMIQSDILFAERRYLEAKEVARSGLVFAQAAVSRCSNSRDSGSFSCSDARDKAKLFADRIKVLNNALLQSH